MDPFAATVEEIRAELDTLCRLGFDEEADRLARIVDRLEDAFRAWRTQPLSIPQAKEETGYGDEYLRELCRQNRLPAEKVGGEWRVRRCDLPRKPAEGPSLSVVDELAETLTRHRR